MSPQEQSTPVDKLLQMDCEAEAERIAQRLREILRDDLHRRGLVVAMSGGIDSSVCAALAVRALGAGKVFGVMMPERDSSSESEERATELAQMLGIEYEVQDIAPALEAIGCYRWRDAAIRRVFPEYGEGWKSKIAIRGGAEQRFSYFALVVADPQGRIEERRLDLKEYLQIVAATNYKQRVRKSIEYFHADRLNYAVVGTPNRLEYDQGFFVKNGDGSADVKPIAHLYKSQVYALARHMDLPEAICNAVPTTDTYSLSQGQDEFYFALPYQQMDVALAMLNSGAPAEQLAEQLQVGVERARQIYADIRRKRQTTAYLHRRPILVGSPEVTPVAPVVTLLPQEEDTETGARTGTAAVSTS
ncbi:MAG: NAD(+) synthase [Thiohalomonadaceae bacterium]